MISQKKHIYIPIELKNRELDSQVILAAEACSRGFRVYIGSHAAIYNALSTKKQRSGIYLEKGTQIETLTKWIRTKCQFIFILDQELNPSTEITDPERDRNLVDTRFYPGTKDLVDGFFCVGPVIFDSAQQFFQNSVKIYGTGWPRIDLQTKYASVIYSKQIADLSRKHGDYLLFVSDFGILTPLSEVKNSERVNALLEISPEDFWDRSFRDFGETIQILRSWDNNPEIPKIIVRPHIVEDIRIWKEMLRGLSKTEVIHDGDITPWISASKGVIHRGSTVSIQAKLMGKMVYYIEEASTSHNRLLVKKISDFIVSETSPPLPELLELRENSSAARTLSDVIYSSNESASKKIIDILIEQDTILEYPLSLSGVLLNYLKIKAIRRFFGLVRDELAYFIKPNAPMPQSKNLPNGIRKKDLEVAINAEPYFAPIAIRRIGINLWELESTK